MKDKIGEFIVRPYVICELIRNLHNDGVIIPIRLQNAYLKEIQREHFLPEIRNELRSVLWIVLMHKFMKKERTK